MLELINFVAFIIIKAKTSNIVFPKQDAHTVTQCLLLSGMCLASGDISAGQTLLLLCAAL